MSRTVYMANDNLLRVDELRDATDGSFLDGTATVTAHVRNRDGTDVGGQAWPVTLAYVPASQGRFHATLGDGLVLKEGRKIFATIVVDAGAGKRGEWVAELPVEKRTVPA